MQLGLDIINTKVLRITPDELLKSVDFGIDYLIRKDWELYCALVADTAISNYLAKWVTNHWGPCARRAKRYAEIYLMYKYSESHPMFSNAKKNKYLTMMLDRWARICFLKKLCSDTSRSVNEILSILPEPSLIHMACITTQIQSPRTRVCTFGYEIASSNTGQSKEHTVTQTCGYHDRKANYIVSKIFNDTKNVSSHNATFVEIGSDPDPFSLYIVSMAPNHLSVVKFHTRERKLREQVYCIFTGCGINIQDEVITL